MKVYTKLLDPTKDNIEQLIHKLEHEEALDTIRLNADDLSRRRFTSETTFGKMVKILFYEFGGRFDWRA